MANSRKHINTSREGHEPGTAAEMNAPYGYVLAQNLSEIETGMIIRFWGISRNGVSKRTFVQGVDYDNEILYLKELNEFTLRWGSTEFYVPIKD